MQRPSWYDQFLYTCNEAMASSELEKAAALALASGGHFLEPVNAEQIFDSILLLNHHELIHVCIIRSQGSRPRSSDLEQLFTLKKGQTLAVIYRDMKAFENDLGKVLTFIHEDFGVDLLLEVFKYHAKNEVSKDIIEKVVKAALTSDNEKKNELLMQISPRMDSEYSDLINEMMSRQNLTMKVTKSLIAYANAGLINSLDKDKLRSFFTAKLDDDLDLAHLKAAIVNKIQDPELILEHHEDHCPRQVLWITKGLLYRIAHYPKTKSWIDKVLTLLEQGQHLDFDTLVSSIDTFFECPTVKSSLAKQKLFSLTKPSLIKAFKANSNPSGHLQALICQLPHVPKFALSSEITEILPLLLQGLKDPDLVLSSLTCLYDLLEHDHNSFSPFIATFLPLWLSMSKDRSLSVPSRIKALQCIKISCKIKDASLSQKKEVLKHLVPALDDHKRLVRQAASAARNQWSIC